MELDFWSRSQKPIVNRTPCNIRVVFYWSCPIIIVMDMTPQSMQNFWDTRSLAMKPDHEADLPDLCLHLKFHGVYNQCWPQVTLRLLQTSQVKLWVSKLMNIVLLLFIFNIGIMCYYFWEILRNHLGTNEKRKMTSTANSVFNFKHDVVD